MLSNLAPRFCMQCGSAKVELKIPHGDDRERHVCGDCGYIHYLNPKIVVGTVPIWKEQVLLCKRAIEPRYGLWTLPAGFMENHESAQEGAAREALEEANAKVEIGDLYTLYSLPHISQVYMMFLAKLVDPDVSPGIESLEVKLVAENEVPWDELAFTMVRLTLQHFFEDRRTGNYTPRVGDIRRPLR